MRGVFLFAASLVGIFRFKELPEKYGPFTQHKASIEKKTIEDDDEIAVLNIEGTESNHVLFLNSYKDIKEIVEELKLVDAELNYHTKKVLEGSSMSNLPVEQTWMVLVELLTDLRKRGVEIEPSIPEDIRMAKTTINFYKVNPADPERMKEVKRINDFLNTAQNKLMDLAETQGNEYRAQWIKKLTQASRGEKVYDIPDKKSEFVVGAPPGFTMVRITFKAPLPEERIQEIAEYHNVIIEFLTDTLIAIYGDKQNIQDSLKEISSFFTEQIE